VAQLDFRHQAKQVIAVRFNDQQQDISSIEQFGIALDRFDRAAEFELFS
jgi:hypothetical protein